MSQDELDNLVRIGRLKAEPGSRNEFAGMVKSARTRLADAQNESLDPTASLTWHMAPRTGWRWPRCVARDTGRKTDHCVSDHRSYVGFGSC
jgi:hypothetical protein